jgi:hypothetical protein
MLVGQGEGRPFVLILVASEFHSRRLRSKTYAALGAIDDEIYILRLRFIPGSAKAFALI